MSVAITYSAGLITLTYDKGRPNLNISTAFVRNVYDHDKGVGIVFGSSVTPHQNYHSYVYIPLEDVTSPVYATVADLLAAIQAAVVSGGGSNVAMAIVTNADVSSAAAEQIVVASTPCNSAFVTAHPDNTGRITLGGASVTDGNGIVLYAADSVVITIDDVNKIYVISSVDGEDVTATYFN